MKRLFAGSVSSLMIAALWSLPAFAVTSKSTIKAEVERTGLLYFTDQAHPSSGLVRDRAENFGQTPEWNRAASIAATGFGLAVVSNAAARGRISGQAAEEYVLKALRFARDHVPRRKGWFLHFVDWETGARLWASEYSTIDTALFMAGALYAAQIFPGNTEISQIARKLYDEIDFYDSMTDGGALPQKRTISMAYTDEEGYTPAQWDSYAEQMILLILGLGHPSRPLPAEAWLSWKRQTAVLPNSQEVMGLDEALFIHQYSEVFIDFRGFQDGYRNYHENGRTMTAYHRAIARDDRRFKSLQSGFWGFSAGESPDGYKVWNPLNYQSTICTGCAIGSAMFEPDEILSDLASWYDSPFHNQLWGRYGFTDSLDLDQNWFASGVLGITVGPAFLALADSDENTSIWKDFMKIPEVQTGLARASGATRTVVTQRSVALPIAR